VAGYSEHGNESRVIWQARKFLTSWPTISFWSSNVCPKESYLILVCISAWHIFTLFFNKNQNNRLAINSFKSDFRHIPRVNVLISFCSFCSTFGFLPWHITVTPVIRQSCYMWFILIKSKQGLDRPLGFQEVEAPKISRQSAHERGKVVSPTHRPPLTPRNIPGTHFCYRLSRLQGHSAAGRIKSMKNSNYTIGNWTRDLTCSAVPQPTAPPRAPLIN
jgi:hypothetical protein